MNNLPPTVYCPNGVGYSAEQMRAFRAEGVAAERERCAAFLERGVDLSGLNSLPGWQRYTVDLLIACADMLRGATR